jgi:hypothetical protein
MTKKQKLFYKIFEMNVKYPKWSYNIQEISIPRPSKISHLASLAST